MVLSYPKQTINRIRYIESYPEQSVQIWWHDVSSLASNFFFVIQQPESMLFEQPLTMLIANFQEAYTEISQMPAPQQVQHLRQCLLASMMDLITGYKEYLAHGDELARAYIQSALFELQFVQMELQELRKNHLVG